MKIDKLNGRSTSSSSSSPQEQNAVLKRMFTKYEDPPWEDFTRTSNYEITQSLILETLRQFIDNSSDFAETENQSPIIFYFSLPSSCFNNFTPPPHGFQFKIKCQILGRPITLGEEEATIKIGTPIKQIFHSITSNSNPFGIDDYHGNEEFDIFGVKEYISISATERDDENNSSLLTMEESMASTLLSALSTCTAQLRLYVPCFVALDEERGVYLGTYQRNGSHEFTNIRGKQPEAVSVRMLSTMLRRSADSITNYEEIFSAMGSLPKTTSLNYEKTYSFTNTSNSIQDTSPLCSFNGCQSFQTSSETSLRQNLPLLEGSLYVGCPPHTFVVEVSCKFNDVTLNHLHSKIKRGIKGLWAVECFVQNWNSQFTGLFNNLWNKFKESKFGEDDVHLKTRVLKRVSYPQFAKYLLFALEHCFTRRIKEDDDKIGNISAKLASLGLNGAPSGSFIADLAWICCELQYGDIVRLWKKCVSKIIRRWNRADLMCRVSVTPEGKQGGPNFNDCHLQQQLTALNCCVQQKINYENAKRSSIITWVAPPYTQYNLNTLWSYMGSTEEDKESDPVIVYKAMCSFMKYNSTALFEDFCRWLNNTSSAKSNTVLTVPDDKSLLYNKWKGLWSAVKSRSLSIDKTPIEHSLLLFHTLDFSNSALGYIERISMNDLLKQLLHVFVSLCLELWGYNKVMGQPSVSEAVCEFMSILNGQLLKTTMKDRELTSAFHRLERVVTFAVYLHQLFPYELQLTDILVSKYSKDESIRIEMNDLETLCNLLINLNVKEQEDEEVKSMCLDAIAKSKESGLQKIMEETPNSVKFKFIQNSYKCDKLTKLEVNEMKNDVRLMYTIGMNMG